MEITCLNTSRAKIVKGAFSKHQIPSMSKLRNSSANSDYITLQKVVVEVCKSQPRSHFMLF